MGKFNFSNFFSTFCLIINKTSFNNPQTIQWENSAYIKENPHTKLTVFFFEYRIANASLIVAFQGEYLRISGLEIIH